jgi:hypothetical protein
VSTHHIALFVYYINSAYAESTDLYQLPLQLRSDWE